MTTATKEKKDAHLTIVVTPAERKAIRQAALTFDVPAATLVRAGLATIMAQLPPNGPVTTEMLKQAALALNDEALRFA